MRNFPSLIFQILLYQNNDLLNEDDVHEPKQHQLKYSGKWNKVKHVAYGFDANEEDGGSKSSSNQEVDVTLVAIQGTTIVEQTRLIEHLDAEVTSIDKQMKFQSKQIKLLSNQKS
ncbi:hypothetical protein PVK06_031660 [Gossypium arboreum]|uniref:Uncharacterized protein n=1 Tax=Gossypium arboreum TaxID=29729 RepID=A0ABR0NSP9_GOSAR|nr:hypothetical protein PVK06_031660 [Gossypium arboreum]